MMSENKELAEAIFQQIKKTFSNGMEISRLDTEFVGCGECLTMLFTKSGPKFDNTRLFIYRGRVVDVVNNYNSCEVLPMFLLWASNDRIQVKLGQISITDDDVLAKMLALVFEKLST